MGDSKFLLFNKTIQFLRDDRGLIILYIFLEENCESKDEILNDYIIDKVMRSGLVEIASEGTVRINQKGVDASAKQIREAFYGKVVRPKWQTLDFYMEEIIKYVVGGVIGAAITAGAFVLSGRSKEQQGKLETRPQVNTTSGQQGGTTKK
ncbi:MAG: hypothetical protein HYU71_03205 [Bacteroidetes bacterium]|nr:hypothetical protein [Bacteroidota bacterium]